jgi:hypothetical protein
MSHLQLKKTGTICRGYEHTRLKKCAWGILLSFQNVPYCIYKTRFHLRGGILKMALFICKSTPFDESKEHIIFPLVHTSSTSNSPPCTFERSPPLKFVSFFMIDDLRFASRT